MPSSRWPTLSLRGRVIASFALGAGLLSAVLAVSAFTLSRSYMVDQRERSAERQAAAHAELMRASLSQADSRAGELVASLETPVDTHLLLDWNGRWYRSGKVLRPQALPDGMVSAIAADDARKRITTHANVRGRPYLVTAVRIGRDGALYELAPVAELQATLRALAIVLSGCAVVAAMGGAALGWWASRRVLTPLHQLADTAASIAGGDLDHRLAATGDRELATIVDSFNMMVDSLHQRIERERRFFGDVSHELRTPLTTLITAVGVLSRHGADLPVRSQQALGLIVAELEHLRRLLDDLLALARMDAGLHQDPLETFALDAVLAHVLAAANHPPGLLTVESACVVEGRRKALERTFLNLVHNADRHGGGLRAVSLSRRPEGAVIEFDDSGPGVPAAERQRIFERFATGHVGRKTTSGGGTGIGLAMVAETVSAHGGRVRCTVSPLGGARFEVVLPDAIVT